MHKEPQKLCPALSNHIIAHNVDWRYGFLYASTFQSDLLYSPEQKHPQEMFYSTLYKWLFLKRHQEQEGRIIPVKRACIR